MEISLEKIELVKDRTGVSYREAKDALIAENGSVVDAIIRIEDEIDIAPKTAAENAASDMIEKIKSLIRRGNVSKVLVKKDDSVVLSIPVTLGVIGAVFLPEAAIFSAIVALGVKCNISIVTTEGEEVDVVKKAREKISDARENYSSVAEGLKEKGSDAFSKIREKADSVISRTVPEDDEPFDDDYFNFDDEYPDPEDLKDLAEEKAESVLKGDAVETAADKAAEAGETVADAVEDTAERLSDAAGDLLDEAEDLADDVEGAFESTINDYKARRKRFFK
jgi:ElaB/YqjD/DUF883 family membrane-anchored ribosome-binding protein